MTLEATSPTAEASGSNPVQCRFESDVAHHLRVSYNGSIRGFHPFDAGSIPVIRSNFDVGSGTTAVSKTVEQGSIPCRVANTLVSDGLRSSKPLTGSSNLPGRSNLGGTGQVTLSS